MPGFRPRAMGGMCTCSIHTASCMHEAIRWLYQNRAMRFPQEIATPTNPPRRLVERFGWLGWISTCPRFVQHIDAQFAQQRPPSTSATKTFSSSVASRYALAVSEMDSVNGGSGCTISPVRTLDAEVQPLLGHRLQPGSGPD